MNKDRIAILYFDRDSYSKRAVRNRQVLFGQDGQSSHAISTPDRAKDFLGSSGASTLVGQQYFDLYILHIMAQDVGEVIDSMLLYAADHPDSLYRIGLIGPHSSVDSESKRIKEEAAALGVTCSVHYLPSDPTGYLNNKSDADQAKRVLQQILEQG